MSTMAPELDGLSQADEAEWEVETLPDTEVDDASAPESGDSRLAAVGSSSRTREIEDQNRQAAKAIEAADGLDRVSPPESQHAREAMYMSSSVIQPPTRTANATEETPLLDAGPAQPPPDYAAATAGRRARPSYGEEADIESGNSVMSAHSHPLRRPVEVTLTSALPRSPESMADPPPSTPTSTRKRRPSTLTLVCLGVYMLLYFMLLGTYKGLCYLGRAMSAAWRYCRVVSAIVLALVISAGVLGVVLILLKKKGVV